MTLEHAFGSLYQYYENSLELIVDSFDDVYYVDKKGEIIDAENVFSTASDVEQIARNLLKLAAVEYKPNQYSYDFTIDRATRVHIAFPPMSQKGVVINLMKIPKQNFNWDNMKEWKVIREEGITLITDAIKNGKNLLVSGSVGSGKTTLLNICANSIPLDHRVVCIERVPNLLMDRKRQATLIAPNNKVSEMSMLVDAAKKMRADYLVHSYIEGPETIAFMELIRDGHSAMALTSGENIFDAIKGLEFKAQSCNYGRSIEDIRYTIANSFDLIIFQERMPDDKRKITRIASISYDEGKIKLDVLYTH